MRDEEWMRDEPKERVHRLWQMGSPLGLDHVVLLPIGWEGGVSFANQSQSAAMQNQNKYELLSSLNWKPSSNASKWKHGG